MSTFCTLLSKRLYRPRFKRCSLHGSVSTSCRKVCYNSTVGLITSNKKIDYIGCFVAAKPQPPIHKTVLILLLKRVSRDQGCTLCIHWSGVTAVCHSCQLVPGADPRPAPSYATELTSCKSSVIITADFV